MKTLSQISDLSQSKLISITTPGNIRFVEPDRIVYLESSNNYTSFHLNNGETYLMCKPLSYYEEMLTRRFFRCHRSYLVNGKYIKEIDTVNGNLILLSNRKIVPISRRRLSHFKKVFVEKSI